MNGRILLALITILALLLTGASGQAVVNIGDYTATPPFVSRSVSPNVMLLVSNDHTNFYRGYRGLGDYSNAVSYYGYFDPDKCYKYGDPNGLGYNYFYTQDDWNAFNHYTVDGSGQEADGSTTAAQKDMWSGNFLNWVTMCHGDFVRKTLTGGYYSATDNSAYWILERGSIPDDGHKWTKTYAPAGVANPDIGGLVPYAPCVAATFTPEYPSAANQVLSYDFEDSHWSGTTITDTAGVNNSGTATNGASSSTTAFYGSKSLNLDGTDDYVQIADHAEISSFGGQLTVEFWMRRDSNDNNEQIIGNGGTTGNNGFAVVSRSGGGIRFRLWRSVGADSDSGQLDSVTIPSNGAWHYIVCTYNSAVDVDWDPATPATGVMRIYIDGCLDAESTTEFNGNVGDSTYALQLGRSAQAPYNAAGQYFDGRLDEVSLWREALTEKMVRSRYENTWGSRTIGCLATFGGGTFTFYNVFNTVRVQGDCGGTPVDRTFTVRVRVTTQPTGLLQDFSNSIRFGLMSYSYDYTDQGGVLRANVSKPGEAGSQFNDMITFVNTFTQKGWDPSAEVFWETTRYFRNSSRVGGTTYPPNTDFRSGTNDGFPIRDWVDPLQNECQKNFIIIVNDEYPSRDKDKVPGGYQGLAAETIADLAPATVDTQTAPTGGLSAEWWTNRVGEFEGINGTQRRVGCYETDYSGTCDPLKTVDLLGRAYGICPNEPTGDASGTPATNGTFNIAGAAYWARMTHLRPDLVTNAEVTTHPEKKITIETYSIAFRASPSGYIVPEPPMNQLWLAAKYGGFQDANGNGKPDLQSEWDEDGDGVPDNFAYAEEGEQFSAALRKALLSILSRSASGTAASILSASRSGQGALYQAMFYPSRVDRLGDTVEWTGHLNAFWVDQFGNLREETSADPVTPPATITQPFTGASVPTSGIELRQLNLYHDKVVKLYFDTTLGRTRAKLYQVSTLGRIVSGKATKSDSGVLWDAGASFVSSGVSSGMVVENLTAGTSATITAANPTTLTAAGVTWTVGDEYTVSQAGPDPQIKELEDLNPLWDGGRWLAEHGAKDRRIFTWVDLDGDGQVDGARALFGTLVATDEVKELKGLGSQLVTIGTGARATTVTEDNLVLDTDTIASALRPYLRATSNLESAQIVNWIRGVDQPATALRRRTYLTPNDTTTGWLRTLKLGDIVYSTPTIVGTPTEDYDLLYKDSSYTGFYRAQGDRRNVVFVGANDGMLHAFNGGFYDRDYGIFYDHTSRALGQELWAFIPYQLLPHLEFLTRGQYVHVYYVDQKPKVFDARIFTADATHVNGWGTLLLMGMRMGGKNMTVTDDFSNPPDGTSENRTFRSAYFLLDVTDPLQPAFLGSFTDANLGLTTCYPAIFRIQDKWFMIAGSGPNGVDAYGGVSAQRGFLFVVEITSSGFTLTKKIPVPDGETTAFLGDPSAVDLDLTTGASTLYPGEVNWTADAIYIGSIYDRDGVSASPYQWRGRMYHLRLTSDASMTTPDLTANSWAYAKLAESSASLDVGPITAAANVARDAYLRYWVYFGTGRYYSDADVNDTSNQAFFALKEPIYTSGVDAGKPTFGSVTMDADTDPNSSTTSLYDATSAKVYEGGAVDYDGLGHYMTFFNLLSALETNKKGWMIQTSGGERMLGMPNVLGGITLFTSYVPPSGTACQYEGTSYLYAPFFKTGTAYKKSVIGLGNDVYNGSQLVQRKTSLGVGVATTPTIHVGEKSKAFIQSSTGTIIDMETTTAFPVKSGVRSWRTE